MGRTSVIDICLGKEAGVKSLGQERRGLKIGLEMRILGNFWLSPLNVHGSPALVGPVSDYFLSRRSEILETESKEREL